MRTNFNLTNRILHTDEWKLFFIFLISGVTIHTSEYPMLEILIGLISGVSQIILLCWLYTIVSISKQILINGEMSFAPYTYFKYFVVSFVCVLVFVFVQQFFKPTSSIAMSELTILIIWYILIFMTVAKTLVSAENKREAEWDEYCYTFLLLLIYPIAIWFIQPRLRKISALVGV